MNPTRTETKLQLLEQQNRMLQRRVNDLDSLLHDVLQVIGLVVYRTRTHDLRFRAHMGKTLKEIRQEAMLFLDGAKLRDGGKPKKDALRHY